MVQEPPTLFDLPPDDDEPERDPFDVSRLFDTGSIHSSVPEHVPKPDWGLYERIKAVLPRMQGRENAMKSNRIAELTGGFDNTGTQERVRRVMKYLLCVDKVPVVGCHDGFFVAVRPEELADVVENHRKRILGLLRNMNAMDSLERRMRRRRRDAG